MEEIENKQNTTNKTLFPKIDVNKIIKNLQDRFKINKEVQKSDLENVPVNKELERSDGKLYNQYGRTRVGFTSGLYFNTKPYPYNNGGII